MVLQIKTKLDETNPVHIYFDIEMINNDQANGEPTPKLVYNQSRNSPFINCPSLYYVSIVRFNLQSPSLPVFIPQVKINQQDVNKLIYQFYLIDTSNQNHWTQNVNYIPSNYTLPSPRPPLIFQDLTTEYYYVYTIQDWVNMLNQTLFTLANTAGVDIPFFYFDVNTSLLKFYAPQSWANSGIQLGCNKQLQTLLDSFQFIYNNSSIYGNIYTFKVINDGLNSETLNNVNYYVMKQETTTIGLLNPVKSIVFTTGLFPIRASLTSPPIVFGADSTLFNQGNNSNISPIITDFEVNVSNLNTYKETIQYIPSGEYRLIDLYGESPCNTLELSCFWKDHFGNLHNFKLNSGCSCDMKIMFRRKDFNNINLGLD